MSRHLVSLWDLPTDGRSFHLDDQEIWLESIKKFHMDCRINEPLQADIHVLPADNGCLVRGDLTGSVILPCNLCAEDTRVSLAQNFQEYEEIPEQPLPQRKVLNHQKKQDATPEESSLIIWEQNSPMLDLDALCWEEFILALPFNPICRSGCKGLCPKCGANLNQGPCGCSHEGSDDRMASLRQLIIKPVDRTPGSNS